MPTIKSVFQRRKSGNLTELAVQSSFRVLDQHEKPPTTAPPGSSNGNSSNSERPPSQLRRLFQPRRQSGEPSAVESSWSATPDRTSGGTTNSGSSGFYDSANTSARHSSSTLPSSVDNEREEPKPRTMRRADPPTLPSPSHLHPIPQSTREAPVTIHEEPQRSPGYGRSATSASDATVQGSSTDFRRSPRPLNAMDEQFKGAAPVFPARTQPRQTFVPPPWPPRREGASSPSDNEGPASPDPLIPGGSGFGSPTRDEARTRPIRGTGKAGYSLVGDRESWSAGSSTGGKPDDRRILPQTDRREIPHLSATPSTQSFRSANAGSWHESGDDLFVAGSSATTPRANNALAVEPDEALFGSSSMGPASRAVRPGGAHARTPSAALKRMTLAEFDELRRTDDADADEDEESRADDDEEEAEHGRKMARQRARNEANMSVYRQQMKKVAGGGLSGLPSSRPNMDRSVSGPAFGMHMGGMAGPPPAEALRGRRDDDDDDVPLGILQAHGFPGGVPPSRPLENDISRRSSGMSVVGGDGGAIPPFAKRLPQDPYFGAGLVRPTQRESLGFAAPSEYGIPASSPSPGGLVGVIADEERARAARRANPNQASGFMPPPNQRTLSMNMMPLVHTPTGMQWTSAPQDPQMQQFMQLQMQLMQNMLALQQQQQFGVDYTDGRAMSMMGPPSGRAMSVMQPMRWEAGANASNVALPLGPNLPRRPTSAMPNMGGAAAYAPSIAPSERSNIGLPNRYRPVSTLDLRSMSTLGVDTTAYSKQQASPDTNVKTTVRVVDKPKGSPRMQRPQSSSALNSEEDEEGWAEMARKRNEQKKKFWARRSSRIAEEAPTAVLG
ncbi:hypothetical protein K470DRAFT_274390 [Piedraia hortae CBS 480.64]|uniref:Uncharacterized protein n=1 Tax=Piedraia hortae CBS 480.64 TaxID=1314780 RepID=A0A6A7C7N9_9PEZI|nr:hypothetical protein K470DRAFT_274390 [Piedraia hortae CBS 480.64]